MKVVLLGAGGQLGAAIRDEFRSSADVIALDHRALDLTDADAVCKRIGFERPAVIINCVAYNQVDAAESEPLAALAVNALGVRTLARAANDYGATLVHYSTDFVFDGDSSRPYTEDDRPNPQSVYAASKLLGEWFAADAPTSYVLRVESLFGSAPGGPARGSAESIRTRIRAGEEVTVFADRTVSPTYVPDAAWATREILDRRLPSGVYHCVSSGWATWLAFAEEVARVLGVEARLKRVTLDSVRLPAKRPKYCALSNQKLAAHGVTLPDWQNAIRRWVS